MTQPLTNTVAAGVRAELARRGISRADAATKLGISRTLLWHRLRGDSSFTVAELEAMAELLGVSVAEFFPVKVAAA